MAALEKYHQKRTFTKTPEPKGTVHKKNKELQFVVQEHHASHLHWDFRLEMDGVLKSWAIPKGPSMDPEVKHLAVHVEDHPYEYRKFAGTIPAGNYGAGTVKIWDKGTYEPVRPPSASSGQAAQGKPAEERNDPEKILLAELKKGDLKFIMHGKKLKGEFALVQLHGDGNESGKNWLLIKKHDTFSSGEKATISPAKKTPMPHHITPMLAKLSEKSFSEEGWIYELKWDGYRAVAEIEKGKVHLYSRNQLDFTQRYSEVVKDLELIQHDAVLDGEIVAVDATGTSKFQYLQDYTKKRDVRLIYEVFDLLYLDGYDLRGYPLIERKKLLKKLLPSRSHISYSDHVEKDGDKLFELAKKKEMEGIMAKKSDSPYVSVRSNHWLKIKNIQMQEAIICGYTQPQGSREAFGALVLGIYDNGEFRYVGHTGSGFNSKTLQDMMAVLKPLETDKSPFAHAPKTNQPATWVKPKLIAQIKFSEWTRDGIMRQPIFLGLRTDKNPKEVTQEALGAPSEEKKFAVKNDLPETKVEISNPNKIFWPQEGYTKGDVIAYYDKVAPFILPYLKDRAESLNRHPDGIEGESFYHKDMQHPPKWATIERIYSGSDKKYLHWLVCNDLDTLLYMANLGCIEINPWSSRISKKEFPDYLIIDLDPNGAPFSEVINTAQEVKKIMDRAKLPSFVKTSGKTGLHILVPLGAKYTFEQTKQFAQILANMVFEALPHTTSIVRNPEKREKKVYIDFLQNRMGQTLAAPYSLRPVPGAQVSTPLEWKEVKEGLLPSNFTIENIFKRLEKHGDLWKGFLGHKGIDMQKSLKLLQAFN